MKAWHIKLLAKLILGRVPYKNSLFRRVGAFKHGNMDDVSYAYKIFEKHRKRAFPDGLPAGFTAVELGPGDSLASALIAKAHGAQKTYHVDVGSYATGSVAFYGRVLDFLKLQGHQNDNISTFTSLLEMLERNEITYFSDGLKSLKEIPSDSVDFIWSQSVLEHVRRGEYEQTMKELRRILKEDGRISHSVDLMDHLNYELNNLRFPMWFWENNLVANSGFYTNRISRMESINMMESSGLELVWSHITRWDKLPTPKKRMNCMFHSIPDDELCISRYVAVLKARESSS